MLLSQEEIKQQTRELWRNNFSHSDEFLDIYFDEKYADENNLTIRHDGNVVASMQLLPYRYTFYHSRGASTLVPPRGNDEFLNS